MCNVCFIHNYYSLLHIFAIQRISNPLSLSLLIAFTWLENARTEQKKRPRVIMTIAIIALRSRCLCFFWMFIFFDSLSTIMDKKGFEVRARIVLVHRSNLCWCVDKSFVVLTRISFPVDQSVDVVSCPPSAVDRSYISESSSVRWLGACFFCCCSGRAHTM